MAAGPGGRYEGAGPPDAQTELAEDLSIALLLALDRLSPLERAVFLLHDVFDCSFTEVAGECGHDVAVLVDLRRSLSR
jgi:DNA-directed RNA polymerase specialized sigma24 family protein